MTVRTERAGRIRMDPQLEAAHMRRVKDAIATGHLSEYAEDVWPRDSPQWRDLVKKNRPESVSEVFSMKITFTGG